MSRAATNGRGAQPHRIAALHEQGAHWRLLVVSNGEGLTILDALTLARGDCKALDENLQRHQVGALVRVAPASRTICRCVFLPLAEPEPAAAALALLAEAQLPEGVPAHRRAAGLIPDRERAGSSTGLLTAWPERADLVPRVAAGTIPERWIALAAALAFVRSPKSGVAAYLEPRSDGAEGRGRLSLIVSGVQKTLARSLLEESATPESWAAAVAAALNDGAEAVGLSPPAVAPEYGRASLLLDGVAISGLAKAVRGLPGERRWLDDFGIALGAALAATTANPASRALAGMTALERAGSESMAQRAVDWLSTPRHAYAVIVASVVFMILAPVALAAGRLAILRHKEATLAAQTEQQAQSSKRAALYGHLERTRWPMTKLLADVADATPVGVVVESLRLSTEQGLSVQGTAKTTELVYQFEQNLDKSGIFRNVKIDRAETTSASGVEFDASAQVASPFIDAPPIEDFAKTTLAVRLYGEGASNTQPPGGGDSAQPERGPGRRDAAVRAVTDERPAARAKPATPQPAEDKNEPKSETKEAKGGKDAPAVLSDAAIAVMDFKTAMSEMVDRSKYINSTKDLDKATRERLETEKTKLKERMAAAKGASGAAGSTAPAGGKGDGK